MLIVGTAMGLIVICACLSAPMSLPFIGKMAPANYSHILKHAFNTSVQGQHLNERSELYQIVVSSWSSEENMDWILSLHKDISVSFYNKGPLLDISVEQAMAQRGNVRMDINANIGRECFGYLKYIIDNYDSLPLYSTFVHAEVTPGGWRPSEGQNAMYGVEMLNAAHQQILEAWAAMPSAWQQQVHSRRQHAIRTIPNFVSMNDYSLLRCTDFKVDFDLRECHGMDWIFQNFYQVPSNSRPPQCVSMNCCASFQLSRHIIRSHPREKYWRLWKELQAESLQSDDGGKKFCCALEHSWHMIFRESPIQIDINYRQLRNFNSLELEEFSSLLLSWRPQSCVLNPREDMLNVSRDCHVNTYVDSVLYQNTPP